MDNQTLPLALQQDVEEPDGCTMIFHETHDRERDQWDDYFMSGLKGPHAKEVVIFTQIRYRPTVD